MTTVIVFYLYILYTSKCHSVYHKAPYVSEICGNLSKIEVRFSIFLKGATNSSDIVQIYETSLPL